jgi:hypothetical protein
MRFTRQRLFAGCVLAAVLGVGSAPLAAPPAANPVEKTSVWDSGNRSVVQDLGQGVKAYVFGKAKIEVERPTRLMLGSGNEQTPAHVIRVSGGRVDLDVPATKPQRVAVLVRGPGQLAAIFKGGRGAVVAAPDRLVAVAFSGEALAGTGNSWQRVPAQHWRHFTVTGTGGALASLPRAPEAIRAPHLAMVTGSEQANTSVSWPAVTGAFSYEVLVTKRGSDEVVLRRTVERPEVAFQLPAGRYQAQLRAKTAFGFEGASSTPQPLRVVRIELPPGATFGKGVVRLGVNQRVHVVDTEGLEATYDDASDFVPLPDSMGLIRRRTTLLRLREQGRAEQVQLRLEPRLRSASVELGPKQATWPRDRVTVTIRAKSGSEDAAPKLTPRVLLNVSPVQMQWEQKGGTWIGVVPRPVSPGPWVVRVEVEDEYGELLARDHLEVAAGSGR